MGIFAGVLCNAPSKECGLKVVEKGDFQCAPSLCSEHIKI